MTYKEKVITRRDFLRTSSYFAMGSFLGLQSAGDAMAKENTQSRVVLIRNPNVLDANAQPVPKILEAMLDQAITVLLDTRDVVSAWQKLFRSTDIIGIKSNIWYHLPTPRALETAIQSRLLEVGVQPDSMSVDDRGILSNPAFKRATALINIRPLRTHHWSGLGTLLKNYIMFTPSPWQYHGNACERLGAIWHYPIIKGKTRLNILVVLTPLFHGIGPHHFSQRYTWPYCGLIVSTDPVAADTIGAIIIQAKRNIFFKKEKPISPPPHHIVAADKQFGLGHSDPSRIELVKLGWDKDILI
jgi:hypothetical protein